MDLLKRYLQECSQICDAGGYTRLERELPLIKKKLSNRDFQEIIEKYNHILVTHCKGKRIFGWGDVNEKTLVGQLSKISNIPPKS